MYSFKKFIQEYDMDKIDPKLGYHDDLNPKIWDGQRLRPKVAHALERIADEFIEYLELSDSAIKDIIITGSNCGFNYTPLSDIDLHLVVDFSQGEVCPSCTGDFIADCFQAKKALWNSMHDITIYGYDVELYAQDAAEKHIAPGVYSIMNREWVIAPVFNKPTYDSFSVKAKAGEIMDAIDSFVESESDDIASIKELKDKIRKMRQAGLQMHGLYSVENLAFKTLRNNGYLEKLSAYLLKIQDNNLSLED